MNLTTYPRPTRETVTAARARALSEGANYDVELLLDLPGMYHVQHRADTDRYYIVDVDLRECTCPAFERKGYCKHFALVQNERRAERLLLEQEADYTDRQEARLDFITEWEAENL